MEMKAGTTAGDTSFGREARSRIAANVLLVSALAILLAVFVNYFTAALGEKRDVRLDLTRDQRSELQDGTKKLLRNLPRPIECYLVWGIDDAMRKAAVPVVGGRTPDSGIIQNVYRPLVTNLAQQVRFLLDEAAIINSDLKIYEACADREVDLPNRWARDLDLGANRLLNHLVIFDRETRAKRTYSLYKLFDMDLGGPDPTRGRRRPIVKGDFIETYLVAGLKAVSEGRPRVAGMSGGHAELPLFTVRQLLKSWNTEVRDVDIDRASAQLDDLDLLIVASPEREWSDDAKARLRKYVDGGGRLLITQGARCREYFLDLLEPAGVKPMPAQVASATQSVSSRGVYHLYGYELLRPKPGEPAHPITATAVRDGLPIELGFSRAYEMLKDWDRSRILRKVLLRSGPGASTMPWIFDGKDWRQAEERGTLNGDFPLAVAIEFTTSNATKKARGRVLVFGSDEWLDEGPLLRGFNLANLDILANSVDWLTGREKMILGTPRSFRGNLARLDQDTFRTFRWLAIGIIPVMVLLVGCLVFLLRRR
ncbi:MAG TPA: hypothetical protein ENK43_05090 [Planctomycetes bacterium]|nr:hypothetical protein [Planctomycetota bacterium]